MKNNFEGKAERCLITCEAVEVKVGEIIEFGKHWTTGDSVSITGDACENVFGDFLTVIKCNNLKGHQVEYSKLDEDNEEEYNAEYAKLMEKYGISNGCEEEEEVIVENAKFEIVSIETEDFYGSEDEDGVPVIRTITVKII